MEQQLKPGPIITLVGGAILIIVTFLDWGPEVNGFETDFVGLLGIFTLIIGIAAAVNAGLEAFAPQVERPDGALGMSRDQIAAALGFAAFCWFLGFQFLDGAEFGVTLGWIGAAAVVAGSVITRKSSPASSPGSDQPTQF